MFTVLNTRIFKSKMMALGRSKVRIADCANPLGSLDKIAITRCESMRLKLCKARFVFEVKFNTVFQYIMFNFKSVH